MYHVTVVTPTPGPSITRYLMYWGKLSTGCLVEYCTAILTNSEKSSQYGDQNLYFLLSEHCPEDKKLRLMLKDIKLVCNLFDILIKKYVLLLYKSY